MIYNRFYTINGAKPHIEQIVALISREYKTVCYQMCLFDDAIDPINKMFCHMPGRLICVRLSVVIYVGPWGIHIYTHNIHIYT